PSLSSTESLASPHYPKKSCNGFAAHGSNFNAESSHRSNSDSSDSSADDNRLDYIQGSSYSQNYTAAQHLRLLMSKESTDSQLIGNYQLRIESSSSGSNLNTDNKSFTDDLYGHLYNASLIKCILED